MTMDKVQQEIEETVRLALSKNLNDVELNRALNNAVNIDRQFFPPMAEVVEAGSKQQVTGKGLEELIDKEGLNEAEYQGKEVQLGKPKRGGSKKFYVYVKDPKTKKVKKVNFGDTTGLSTKINNPKARKAFAARQNCDQKKDRTKPGYWACNLPRYAKSLGLKSSFSGYW